MDPSRDPGRMYVEESGTPGAPAIVFIHGAGQSGREWRRHMATLAGFHCLAPDLPGFGRSSHLPSASKERIADLVAELIETRVPAKRASVIGISSAGMVIHALLDRHPDRVERAVIDGSPPYDAPRVGRALMRLFMTALSPFIHTRPVLAMFRETHDQADLRLASRPAFRRALEECFTTYATIGAPCPTLLVAGGKESRVRPTNAALAALMPHAEAWYAPGFDHCWQRKAPDLHIRMVAGWVSGQDLPAELRREPPPRPEALGRMRRETARPGGPMHVEESGTPGSPAILFLHGVGQSSREWREHMAQLSGFHCLAPDLPGHGRSNHLPLPSNDELVDDLAALIETRVPAGRAHVVGISWGAFLVQVLMQRHPDRVERAVSDGTPLVWPRWAKPMVLALAAITTPFLHTRPVLALYRDTHDPVDVRATSRRAWWRTWAVALGHLAAATEAPCPTLLVAGEKEGYVRPADAALATLMPHAEAWYAPGLDHCWQRKAPDLHIRMLEAWLSGQELPSELRPELAPAPEMVEQVRRLAPENWYLRHRSRIMWEIRLTFRHHRGLLAEAYGKAEGKAIARETMQRFEVLLRDLPFIGGDENPNTQTLYMTAYMLALYQSLRMRGETVEGAARLMYQGASRMMGSIPFRLLLRWQGWRLFDRNVIEQRRRRAIASQERRYPGDWVSVFVEGDGHPFEHGLDYTECGVVKYLEREGAPELAPYLCWLDYPGYAAMGVKLIRTQTIAQGGQTCDFRFSRGKPVPVEPEFLHV